MAKCPNRGLLRVLLVHPGTQHAPRLAAELERQGVLWRFWTGAGVARGARQERFWRKRAVDVPAERLRTIPWVEMLALGLARLPINHERVWHWRNWMFQKLIPQSEIEAADVVVGFDTAAWVIGERAKKAGKKFVLDQSVGHPLSRSKEILASGGNEETWPEAFSKRLAMVRAAEAQEHDLADVIVVASSFTKKTLVENGVLEEKIRLLPYGVAEEFLEVGKQRGMREQMSGNERGGGKVEIIESRRFRFLYAGYLTRRKGVKLLMDAWEGMEHEGVELRLAGGGGWAKRPSKGVVFLGQISRDDLVREMAQADAFVFPSLFEGFGLVLLEAMAAGLPVITTPNTAGPDLFCDGREGVIVPAGNVMRLRQAMEKLRANPKYARVMGCYAHELAATYTWEKYGDGWIMRATCEEAVPTQF